MTRSAWLLCALLSGVAVTTVPRAAEVPDDGLLEFLGSVDSEDRAWNDYLARTDIDKVARRANGGPANPVGSAPPPKPANPPGDPPPSPVKPVTPP